MGYAASLSPTSTLPRIFTETAAPAPGTTVSLAEDLRLVDGILNERPAAVRQFVERFQGEIYGLCVRLLADRHEAEDVAQEVFLRVFRSLGSWDRQRPLRPWLARITINRCRTFLAKRARRPHVCDNLHQQEAREHHESSADELRKEIQRALAVLRPDYRDVFVLFHEQGWQYEDIAAALERPVGTIKTWLHRARLEILERLRARGMVGEACNDLC